MKLLLRDFPKRPSWPRIGCKFLSRPVLISLRLTVVFRLDFFLYPLEPLHLRRPHNTFFLSNLRTSS